MDRSGWGAPRWLGGILYCLLTGILWLPGQTIRYPERVLQAQLPERIPAIGLNALNQRAFFEAGDAEILIRGLQPRNKRLQGAANAQVPSLPDITCDGILGFDVLRELSFDLDYQGQAIYLPSDRNY